MMPGLFICFEGGDAVGKSSQVRALSASLTASGVEFLVTHEPGGTSLGTRIREMLLDPGNTVDDRCEALLYAADKAQHVSQVIIPALQAGQVVVCDRYVDSMLAYQGAGRRLDADEVAAIVDWATSGLVPDLTVVLDGPPRVALARKSERDRLEREPDAFHERVRDGFVALANRHPDRYLVLDAEERLPVIAARIRDRVGAMLGRDLVAVELPDPTVSDE